MEHFGDIIACEPVIRYVRAQYPADQVVWIGHWRYRELVAFHPDINEVLTVSCLTECSRLIHTGAFDHILDLHINLHCSWFGHTYKKIHESSPVTIENYFSHGNLLEAFCKSADIPSLHNPPVVHIPSAVQAQMNCLIPDEPYIVIHATSNMASKDWSTDQWVQLTNRLGNEMPFVLVEVGLQARIADQSPRVLNFCGRSTPIQLAELIRRASGFIGIDSGPAHLANAFQRPSVILMGRYMTYDRYMPFNGYLQQHVEDMLICWNGPVSEIPVDEVMSRARKVFSAVGINAPSSATKVSSAG